MNVGDIYQAKNLIKNRLNLVIAAVLIVAALAIGWQVGHWGKTTELAVYREQVEQFQAEIVTVNQYADSLIKKNKVLLDSLKTVEEQIKQYQIETEVLVNINEEIKSKVDSLQQEFAAIDPELIPPPVLEYIGALETQVDTLEATVETQRQLIGVQNVDMRLLQGLYVNEKARADSLQTTLDGFPGDVPDNEKFLWFIPMPSRTVSFISGVATATVGIIALSK